MKPNEHQLFEGKCESYYVLFQMSLPYFHDCKPLSNISRIRIYVVRSEKWPIKVRFGIQNLLGHPVLCSKLGPPLMFSFEQVMFVRSHNSLTELL